MVSGFAELRAIHDLYNNFHDFSKKVHENLKPFQFCQDQSNIFKLIKYGRIVWMFGNASNKISLYLSFLVPPYRGWENKNPQLG